MSSKLGAVVTFASIVAIALAVTHAGQQDSMTLRGPASISPQAELKEQILGEIKAPKGFHHTEKASGPLRSQVELISGNPAALGETFVLHAHVVSTEEIHNVQFSWAIPSGVKLVSGTQIGQISDLIANTPVDLELTLQKTSGRNEQVHLILSGVSEATHFGHSAQFNTDLEPVKTVTQSVNAAGVMSSESTPNVSHPPMYQ